MISLCSVIKQTFKLADFVAVVPGRYDLPYSIKSWERSGRNAFQYPERLITGPQMKVPANFKGFQSNPGNKMHLIKFLFDDWEVRFRNILVEIQILLFSLLDGSTLTITNGVVHILFLATTRRRTVKCLHFLHTWYRNLVYNASIIFSWYWCCSALLLSFLLIQLNSYLWKDA